MLERYRKAVAPLPVRIVPDNVFCTRLSSLPELPPDRICLQFIKEEMYYLVSLFCFQVYSGLVICIFGTLLVKEYFIELNIVFHACFQDNKD